MTVDGSRPQQNSYLIDGINVNDYTNGGPGSVVDGVTLGVDAVQEFSVITANYSAESDGPREESSLPRPVGNNSFHGDAYEFEGIVHWMRRTSLTIYRYSEATLFAGPNFGVPGAGRSPRTGCSYSGLYEGIRQNQGFSDASRRTLDGGCANGIIHNADGTTTTITVDPLVAPYLPLWHVPNAGLLAPGNTGIYSFVGQNVASENFVTTRFDYNISQNDSFFATYHVRRRKTCFTRCPRHRKYSAVDGKAARHDERNPHFQPAST